MSDDVHRRLVEMESENARLRDLIRIARERLYDAHGRDAHTVYLVIQAVGAILRRADEKELTSYLTLTPPERPTP